MVKKVEEKQKRNVVIEAPKFEYIKVNIVGDTKLVIHKFSQKAREQIKQTQILGNRGKKGSKREGKDFDALYKGAMYVSNDGWYGFPSSAVRQAMVRACSIVGFHMTKGKESIFIEHDGYDAESGTPLTRITKGSPHPHEDYGRISKGIDLNIRPMWDEGWEAVITIRYDADVFSSQDVINLLSRAGMQVGIMEGRPFSKESCGCGWGTFRVKEGV